MLLLLLYDIWNTYVNFITNNIFYNSKEQIRLHRIIPTPKEKK